VNALLSMHALCMFINQHSTRQCALAKMSQYLVLHGCTAVRLEDRRGNKACTFPYSLMTLPGSGLGLMAIPAENVGTLLLLGMTLTVGDTSMKMGDAFTFVGEALIPAAKHSQPLGFR